MISTAGWRRGRTWGFLLICGLGSLVALLRLEAEEPFTQGIRALVATALVLGLVFVGAHFAKKLPHTAGAIVSSTSVPIHVLGTKGMGDGRFLVVVEVAGERFLLGMGRSGFVRLAQIGGGVENAPAFIEGESAG
jgi:hypothetical protein